MFGGSLADLAEVGREEEELGHLMLTPQHPHQHAMDARRVLTEDKFLPSSFSSQSHATVEGSNLGRIRVKFRVDGDGYLVVGQNKVTM